MAANKDYKGEFSAPPSSAPREVSQPLRPDAGTIVRRDPKTGAILEALSPAESAAAHERQLQPLQFTAQPDPALAPKPAGPRPRAKNSAPAPAEPPKQEASSIPAPAQEPEPISTAPGIAVPTEFPYQPAASDTDSPSRGIPHPSLDPGRAVTGGWGQGPPQYFALTGDELRELVRSLFDRLNDQLNTDLRFGIAAAYPQVRATVIVKVDGATETAGINDVAFDLQAARLLTLTAMAADTDETPPDQLRDEIGLPKPQKVLLAGSTTGRPMYADVHR